RDHVHALAIEGIQINRKGGDERFSFTGPHLGDGAVVEHDAADQLDVEMAHVEEAAAGLTHYGEGLNQQVIGGCALSHALSEFNGFSGKVDIGELLHLRFELIDGRDGRQKRFDLALVFGAEYFSQNGVDHTDGLF